MSQPLPTKDTVCCGTDKVETSVTDSEESAPAESDSVDTDTRPSRGAGCC